MSSGTGDEDRLFDLKVFWRGADANRIFAIEIALKKRRLSPAYVAILEREAEILDGLPLAHGLKDDAWFARATAYSSPTSAPQAGGWRILRPKLPLSPIQSCYVYCRRVPTLLVFGQLRGPQFRAILSPSSESHPGLVPPFPIF